MKILNTLLNLIIVAFAVFVVLLLTPLFNENTILSIQSEEQILTFYKTITGAGTGLVMLKILVSYLYIADLKHENYMAQLKINDLKVNLYEKRQNFRKSSYGTIIAEEEEISPAATAG
jgi:hypothetical protein